MSYRFLPIRKEDAQPLRQRAPRQEDSKHLKFIRELPCVICADTTSTEACHIRYSDSRYLKFTGGGEKPDDLWTVPMCSKHHKEQTAMGEGPAFWEQYGFDPHALALMLHRHSGDTVRGAMIVMNWNGWLR